MDDIIEFVIELLGEVLEEVLGNIKNPKKRRWALTIFYSLLGLVVTVIPAYFAVAFVEEGNDTGAIVLGVITGALFLVFGFLIVRGHRQNWKKH